MKELDSRPLDPQELVIDPENERKTGVRPQAGDNSLVDSVRELGVVTPIVVREREGKYSVVAGQRRTLAAQTANLDEIPARIMEMSDAEAKILSIAENTEDFDKEVSIDDRAKAVQSLYEAEDMSQAEIADQIGVSQPTVSGWLEPVKSEWDGTFVDPEVDSERGAGDLPIGTLKTIRKNTEEPEKREEIAGFITEKQIKQSLVERAGRRSETQQEFEIRLQEISKELEQGATNVQAQVRFSGEEAEVLRGAMKEYGKSAGEMVEQLAIHSLRKRGLLED